MNTMQAAAIGSLPLLGYFTYNVLRDLYDSYDKPKLDPLPPPKKEKPVLKRADCLASVKRGETVSQAFTRTLVLGKLDIGNIGNKGISQKMQNINIMAALINCELAYFPKKYNLITEYLPSHEYLLSLTRYVVQLESEVVKARTPAVAFTDISSNLDSYVFQYIKMYQLLVKDRAATSKVIGEVDMKGFKVKIYEVPLKKNTFRASEEDHEAIKRLLKFWNNGGSNWIGMRDDAKISPSPILPRR